MRPARGIGGDAVVPRSMPEPALEKIELERIALPMLEPVGYADGHDRAPLGPHR